MYYILLHVTLGGLALRDRDWGQGISPNVGVGVKADPPTPTRNPEREGFKNLYSFQPDPLRTIILTVRTS